MSNEILSKFTKFSTLILSVFFIYGSFPLGVQSRGVNGGTTCAACVIVVGLVEQLAAYHDRPVTHVLQELCSLLPGQLGPACDQAAQYIGPIITDLIDAHETPDVICHAVSLCYQQPQQPYCHLFPPPTEGITRRLWHHRGKIMQYNVKFAKLDFDICSVPGIDYICDLIDRVADDHLPILDLDNDYFSTIETLRGSNWRGRDCNDILESHHPGAKPINKDRFFDSNCNGIYGMNDATGTAYEEELCEGTPRRGMAVLGDSASAHFHIPPQYLMVEHLTKEVLAYIPDILLNEIDWPMTSTATGFKNITWPVLDGTTDSLYLRLRERNRCNHRDYQSIAVNGARSSNMLKTQNGLARSAGSDEPLLVYYALIGNDVCNGGPNTLEKMTTPEEMRENVLQTLDFLENKLPKGSHVMLMGLADGRVLHDSLHHRIHPFGHYRQDITYEAFYNYLNCLQVSPCMGWMSSNETLRDLTSLRAAELSEVLKDVASEKEYQQYDLHYVPNPLMQIVAEWEEEHGPDTAYQLIEPVDGFHPNQRAQALTAGFLWRYMESNLPEYIGDVNPNNAKIEDIFGDQGGH